MDIFHIGYIAYLACVDRLFGSSCTNLKRDHATTSKLMSICWHLFQKYGTPDELSIDRRPPFTSSIFQEFHQTWCVRHTLSSVTYSQSKGWAELTVKTSKWIVNGNTGPQGSLNNDNVNRAILQYQKTLIQGTGLSPVQLPLHCRLCDSIPSQLTLYMPHPEWVAAAQSCNELLHH